MFFPGDEDYSLKEIRDIFLNGNMGFLIHKEFQMALREGEDILIKEEIQSLVTKNHTQYGGSPFGFFYEDQLFCISGGFGVAGIQVINEKLEEEAAILKENRQDIPQYTTYIAHFLSYLGDQTEDPVVYIANMPAGLSKYSPSLKKLEGFVEQNARDELQQAKFSREDNTKSTFFLHFDRVNTPLNRFLFRKITR